MIIPNITPLPPSPQRTDPATFAARADASLTAQETVFTPELNAFASAVNVTQAEMTVLSDTATTQAQIATTQAAAAASSALSAGATVWVSGTTYAVGVSRYSPLDGQVYRRMVGGAGTTDPSQDAVNWRVVNGLTSELIVLPFNNLPSMRPSLNLDFANNQAVDPRITFTRASTATRTNARGLIEAVASGVPRLDFDPVTGACKGLLIEEQRANLFQYSEQADNAYWSKNGVITSDALMAPDGTLTADKLAETSATQSHTVVRATTGTTNTNSYTFSRYLKAGEKTTAVLLIQEVPTYARYSWCVFDLSAGTMGAVTNAGGSSGGVATMQAVGNGWYRCSITATLGGADTSITCPTYPGSLISPYLGTAGAGIYIWGAQLEAGAFPTSYQPSTETFTGRASTATFYGSNGLIQTASSGVARMNYNPMNLTVQPKLLLEASSANLLTYSEAFDNAAWTKTRATVTANATTAPDGALSADKLIEDTTASSTHQIGVFITKAASSVTYTASFFMKAGERSAIRFNANTGAQGFTADFDLVAQTVVPSVYGSGFSSGGASIVAIGGGWFRGSMTFTTDAGTSLEYRNQIISGGTASYTGDGTSGLFIWGAQLEAGAFPTSYIPTVASQVTRVADTSTSAQTTRAADMASMTGANFSSWYRQDEGSFVSDTVFDATIPIGVYGANFQAQAAAASNRIGIVYNPSGQCGGYVESSGSIQMGMIVATPILVPSKFSVAYKVNDFAQSFNGSSVTTDSAGIIPTGIDRLNIGNQTGATYGVQHIRSLSYYPKRLTNAELQALSTQ